MKNHEVEEKIKQAYSQIKSPDIIDSILTDCEMQKGSVMMKNRNRTPLYKGLAFAAMIVVAVVGAVGFNYYNDNYRPSSTVAFDVNPSIELSLNQNNRILEVIPLNDDAKVVVGDMDLKGSDLDVATNALVGSMIRNGYLSDLANSILISVENDDPQKANELQKQLSDEINQLIQTNNFNGAVLSQSVQDNEALRKLANEYGITVGKAQLINQILTMNPLYTFDKLSGLTINELNLLMKNQKMSEVTSTGHASDKKYIGEAKAKEIAFDHAKVKESDVKQLEVEIEYEMGKMVYEIDFVANNLEYDYDIEALTGQVLHVKSEKEDQDEDRYVPSNTSYIGEAKAKEIALNHAKVKESNISHYWIEMDRDNGVVLYEIEFNVNETEYDYEIDALSGKIIHSEKEVEDDDDREDDQVAQSPNSSQTKLISTEQAKSIVLQHANVTANTIKEYKCEKEQEKGRIIFDISFKKDRTEYEYEVNASTGAILKSHKEMDD